MDKISPLSSLISLTTSPGSSKRSSKALVEFKKPEPPAKKKKEVLEEDKYAEELEKIIQRDFFPDLEKLKAQNAYHNAVENNDIHMLRELYSKYSFGATPRLRSGKTSNTKSTPSSFETPTPGGLSMGGGTEPEPEGTPTHLPMAPRPGEEDDDAKSTTSSSSKKEKPEISLNTFLAKYTSEDNQSFQEILENSDKKHKIKYAWLYGKEDEHLEKFDNASALPSIESQANYERPFYLDTWKYKNLNYLMYTPDGAPLTAQEQVELAKKAPKVLYNNTRFAAAPFKEDNVTTGGTNKGNSLFKKPATKIGVDGKEIETETPKVNGFSFVRTPSPTPGVEESPFLTWGEIEGTPFRLDGADTPIPVDDGSKPYRMLETTKREKIAMQLQEKVSERYRDRKLKAIETAKHNLTSPMTRPGTGGTTGRSAFERLNTMSPAARRLIGSHIGSSRDKSLAASYTPKNPSTPKLVTPSPSGMRTGIRNFTPTPTPPQHRSSTPKSSSSTTTSKKSNKASDFF